MALSIQTVSAAIGITANGGCYLSGVVNLGAAPKAIVVTVAGFGAAIDNPERLATQVVVGGFPLTLRRESINVSSGLASSRTQQIWTLDSSAFVGLMSGNVLVEIWRADDNASGTGLQCFAYVLNATGWAAHHVSVSANNGDAGWINPTVNITTTVPAARIIGAVAHPESASGNMQAGAGYTRNAFVAFVAAIESRNADVAAGTYAVNFVNPTSDEHQLVATAIAEVAAGVAPSPLRPFVGRASAAANTVAFALLENQNNVVVPIAPGDIALVFAMNRVASANPPIPALPAGWTTPAGGSGQIVAAGDDIGWRIGWRKLDGAEVNIGVWTNANYVQVLVYRYNVSGAPIGQVVANPTSIGAPFTFGAMPGINPNGQSLVVLLGGRSGGITEATQMMFPDARPAVGSYHQWISRAGGQAAGLLFCADSDRHIAAFAGGSTTPADTAAVNKIAVAVELTNVVLATPGAPAVHLRRGLCQC